MIKHSIKLIAHLFWLIHKLEEWLLVALTGLMLVLACSQIFLRNFFDSGLTWSDALLRILVMWIGLLGALVATRENRHINVDIVSRLVPKYYRRLIELANHLFTTVICLMLAEFGRRFVVMDYGDGIEAFYGIPAWPMELIIPFAFLLMGLRSAYFFAMRLHHIWEKDTA